MTSSEELLVELLPNGILKLMMNRPTVHNAFDDHQIIRLTNALEAAQVNDQVRLIVLGATGRSFSAGGDLNYMRRMGDMSYEENYEDAGRLAKLMKVLNFISKPTIARVQGAAYGGGVGLISCCDIAIGTPWVKMALSEVKLGMVPATISPYVVRTIGEKAARRLFMTGEVVKAQQAVAYGFLSEVVEVEALDERIHEIATAILQNAPQAISVAKQCVFDVSEGPITDDMITHTMKMIAEVRDSDEGREGLSAFLEKRTPNWREEV